MAIFDDVNVANVTSKSDFDFDILGKEQSALFVIVPDEDKIYYTLVTIILGLLYKELVKLANSTENKKCPIEIDWICDEFSNCPPLVEPSIESIISVARSRGLRYHLFIQSLSQLDNVYGKEVSQIILDNSGLAYLKTNTMETAEAVSKRLGRTTLESSSISQSISLTNYNGNKSTSLIGRDLLTPDEVKNLHYKTIIFPNIGYPIFRDTVIYKKLSCYSSGELKRKVTSLEDLSYTYYVADSIELLSEEEKAFKEDLNRFKKYNQESLEEGLEIVKEITKGKFSDYSIKEANGRCYMNIIFNNKLTQKDKSFIQGKLDRDKYEIFILNSGLLLEIHLKNILLSNKK